MSQNDHSIRVQWQIERSVTRYRSGEISLAHLSFSLDQTIEFAEDAHVPCSSDLRNVWFEVETINSLDLMGDNNGARENELEQVLNELLSIGRSL